MAEEVKVLVVEDDTSLNEQVCALLESKGFKVSSHLCGKLGLQKALSQVFHLILLDVRLPEVDGISFLKQLRKLKNTPVIMLTACGAEQDRIEGFTAGADDYLPKPFNFTELMCRITAMLKRTLPASNNQQVIAAEKLQLNSTTMQVKYNQTPVELTPIQFKLLWTLVENSGEILSKPFLYQSVLEREFSQYDRSLDMHISRVRKKLVSLGMPAVSIRTCHGRGYCFSQI